MKCAYATETITSASAKKVTNLNTASAPVSYIRLTRFHLAPSYRESRHYANDLRICFAPLHRSRSPAIKHVNGLYFLLLRVKSVHVSICILSAVGPFKFNLIISLHESVNQRQRFRSETNAQCGARSKQLTIH